MPGYVYVSLSIYVCEYDVLICFHSLMSCQSYQLLLAALLFCRAFLATVWLIMFAHLSLASRWVLLSRVCYGQPSPPPLSCQHFLNSFRFICILSFIWGLFVKLRNFLLFSSSVCQLVCLFLCYLFISLLSYQFRP